MKSVRSRARNDRNLRPRCTPKLRCIRGSLNTEFLQSVNGNKAIRTSLGTEGTSRSPQSITRRSNYSNSDPDVGAYAVHHPIIRASALPIHTELPTVLIIRRSDNHAGSQ